MAVALAYLGRALDGLGTAVAADGTGLETAVSTGLETAEDDLGDADGRQRLVWPFLSVVSEHEASPLIRVVTVLP